MGKTSQTPKVKGQAGYMTGTGSVGDACRIDLLMVWEDCMLLDRKHLFARHSAIVSSTTGPL